MLHDWHQLDIIIIHHQQIIRKQACDIAIIVELSAIRWTLPGTKMHLIDCHWLFGGILIFPLLHPRGILPFIGNIHDAGCICRTHLTAECIRITLHEYLSGLCFNLILVDLSNQLARNKQLVDTGIIQLPHRMSSAIPVVEITNDRHAVCVRCPYSKEHTFHAINGHWMRTHLLIDAVMFSLVEQTDIDWINHRFKHIRIKVCHFIPIVKPDV